MKRLLFLALLMMGAAHAALKIASYRYWGYGPERMFAGYTYQWQHSWALAFDATCYPSTDPTYPSQCTSADYTPLTTDRFVPDPDQTPPGGVQNRVLEFTYPTYKAVNIASGYWNLFQATAYNGATAVQVTITGTDPVTTRFYLTTVPAGTDYAYVQGGTGWPTGTTFHYYGGTSVRGSCLNYTAFTSGVYQKEYYASSVSCVEVTIPASATPGTYDAGWIVCKDTSGTTCTTFTRSITIEAPPVMTLARPSPVPLPSIFDPTVTTHCMSDVVAGTRTSNNCNWQYMATGGTQQKGASYWCTNPTNPDTTLEAANYWLGFSVVGTSQQVTGLGWFYDAPRTWYHTAAWFNQPQWENCGRAIAARYSQTGPGAAGYGGWYLGLYSWPNMLGPYKDLYTGSEWAYYLTLHAPATEWALLAKGIEMGLSRFNQGKYSSTWVQNSWNAQMKNETLNQINYAATGGGLAQNGVGYSIADPRSSAYSLDPYLSYRAAGEPLYKMVGQTPTLTGLGWHYKKQADAIASMLLIYGQPGGEHGNNLGTVGTQTWMLVNTVAETVMNYWEQTHEPRMAKAMKYALDLVASQYDWTNHAMRWVTGPKGFACSGNGTSDPVTKWYNNGALGNCSTDPGKYPELDARASSVYAWYWSHFGDVSFTGSDGNTHTFRELADEMATYGLVGEAGPLAFRWNPKAYYETQRSIYDYLHYRLLAN